MKPLKFLGSIVAEDNTPSAKFAFIEEKLRTKVENINKSALRGERKVAIYSRYALLSMRYFMAVHQINKTHQDKLDTLAQKFIKAMDASIFHPNMLRAKTPSMIYKEATLNNYTLMRLKGDNIVNHVLDSKLEREKN